MLPVLRIICGAFYGLLCVFSIVTGLLYAGGRKELNPLELSDKFMSRYSDPGKRKAFARKMGWVTFAVGIVQGIAAFAIIRAGSPVFYWIALGFTLFSIASVAFKLKGRFNAFPALKCAAYLAILTVLLLGGTRDAFFGKAQSAAAPTAQAEDGKLTADMAYRGVNAYCRETYDWSAAESAPDIMYVAMGEETETEYLVVFRSYTGAFVDFHVDKASGETRMVERVPSLGIEEEAGSINLYDYLG
ncbi:MAG: hypothetical protein J5449_10125 [Oscillospiraceae bacterium]|nr:hypothetical protein [Oscillospiraceae bacterium]